MTVKACPGSLWIRQSPKSKVEVVYGEEAEMKIDAVSEGEQDLLRYDKITIMFFF